MGGVDEFSELFSDGTGQGPVSTKRVLTGEVGTTPVIKMTTCRPFVCEIPRAFPVWNRAFRAFSDEQIQRYPTELFQSFSDVMTGSCKDNKVLTREVGTTPV
jgi:hypothetical protein